MLSAVVSGFSLGAVLAVTSGAPAYAVGVNYAYYTATSGGTQYCAVGFSDLVGYSTPTYDVGTLSSSGVTCNYGVNNYSLSANAQLIYWNMGTPVNCGPAYYNTNYGQSVVSGGYYYYDCGVGTYSATSVHSAWILGYNAGAILSSGYQYFY